MSDTDWDVLDMEDPNTRVGSDGKGYIATPSPSTGAAGASLDGPTPQYAHHTQRQGLGGTQMEATKALPKKPRQMTHDEMMAKAQSMIDGYRAKRAQAEVQGPAVVVDRDDKGMALPAWLTRYGGG